MSNQSTIAALDFRVEPLTPRQADQVSTLLSQADREYISFFHPFEFSQSAVAEVLRQAEKDKFWGIYIGFNLVNLFMLRGLDQGFSVPSFGVFTDQIYSGLGLAGLALRLVEVYCRLNNLEAVCLSVHADNRRAFDLYRDNGFIFDGSVSAKGHQVGVKRLRAGRGVD